ncbi:MAG TPA: polysaccharide deacetylase family protein [Planctomycetaceae bacterium]|nr:polysaccharide deacetylase family protein [Planctomycetaceae bacterium]
MPQPSKHLISRRTFLGSTVAATMGAAAVWGRGRGTVAERKAKIAITLDLEMSRHYPKRGMMEWDFEKGNLDADTKRYAVDAGKIVKERGGVIHYFCVGRVLEQPDVSWLTGLAAAGHPIGNHTYDHVNLKAKTPAECQFRFQRSPWLVRGKTVPQVVRENIEQCTIAMRERAGLVPDGFRTPGGFSNGLDDRPDLQEMLRELGFKWVSSKYPFMSEGKPHEEPGPDFYAKIIAAHAQSQPYVYPSGLVEVPMSPISDVHAFRTLFWKRDWFLKAIRLAVERVIEERATFDLLAHPSCMVVEDAHFETFKLICDLVEQSKGRVELVGLDALAAEVRNA